MTKTYSTLLFGPGSAALYIFQPRACCCRIGSFEFASAARSFAMTDSKSITLSGLIALKMIPVSDANTRPSGGGATELVPGTTGVTSGGALGSPGDARAVGVVDR